MRRAENKKKLGLLALVAGLAISGSFVSGTYARYTSSSTGSDSARVAKWNIELNSSTMNGTVSIDDLFATAYASDTAAVSGNTVVSAGTDDVIAPGTKGGITLNITNKSEVTATYTVEVVETNAGNVPIEYSLDETTWVKPDAQHKVALATDESIAINDTGTAKLYWRWAIDGDASTNFKNDQTDGSDTTLGEAGTATVAITATVVATQVD